MVSDELMLKVENVSKIYKLGEIGGTTLRDELQRLSAKIRHKEDPTKRIGAKNYNKGEKFKALDDVSFDVKKGERIGIIGHNGAGKSTLLKLISRVTGPTSGTIYLNGRVASMLEVGTGFHPELTGRENIYMNGAILGMTKKEIDAKMEDIIEFSEVRQFIDTPVKRYSSGMYVKLAFSVAAHLNSELLIMDEVLAVGDASFQQKCLKKMKDVSLNENKTILYVSHNMATIRQLCDKVLVLEKGKKVFFGDVEKGIGYYMGSSAPTIHNVYDDSKREHWWVDRSFQFLELDILEKTEAVYEVGERIKARIKFEEKDPIKNLRLRFEVRNGSGSLIGTTFSDIIPLEQQKLGYLDIEIPTDLLTPGRFIFDMLAFILDDYGSSHAYDGVFPGFTVEISPALTDKLPIIWKTNYYGDIHLPSIKIK